jgi:RimJ/RimL family protein N-acetyltransferase
MEGYVASALQGQASGREYPFVVRLLNDGGRIVGSTRYLDVDEFNGTAEIGWTWYEPASWGTVVNPECKFLLLRHAFEDWKAIRVCLKTDVRNVHSQAAIRKLGAVYEGTLRNARIRLDGSLRDTVVFSVIDREWPDVKARLLRRLEAAS